MNLQIRVGLLAYSAIGDEHNQAVAGFVFANSNQPQASLQTLPQLLKSFLRRNIKAVSKGSLKP